MFINVKKGKGNLGTATIEEKKKQVVRPGKSSENKSRGKFDNFKDSW